MVTEANRRITAWGGTGGSTIAWRTPRPCRSPPTAFRRSGRQPHAVPRSRSPLSPSQSWHGWLQARRRADRRRRGSFFTCGSSPEIHTEVFGQPGVLATWEPRSASRWASPCTQLLRRRGVAGLPDDCLDLRRSRRRPGIPHVNGAGRGRQPRRPSPCRRGRPPPVRRRWSTGAPSARTPACSCASGPGCVRRRSYAAPRRSSAGQAAPPSSAGDAGGYVPVVSASIWVVGAGHTPRPDEHRVNSWPIVMSVSPGTPSGDSPWPPPASRAAGALRGAVVTVAGVDVKSPPDSHSASASHVGVAVWVTDHHRRYRVAGTLIVAPRRRSSVVGGSVIAGYGAWSWVGAVVVVVGGARRSRRLRPMGRSWPIIGAANRRPGGGRGT